MNVDWTAIGTIFTAIGSCSTALSFLILIVTVVFVQREIHEVRKATYANTYKAALDILQAEEVRTARRVVFRNLSNKQFDSWDDQEKCEAEKVCHSYDSVAQMVRYSILPKAWIISNWGDSTKRSWYILSPLVISYRTQRNSPELWDDYEWLAKES
jgi:hypothetical protein